MSADDSDSARSRGRQAQLSALVVVAAMVAALTSCADHSGEKHPAGGKSVPGSLADSAEDIHSARRERMVEEQIRSRGVTDPDVLDAIGRVPRHHFVPEEYRSHAYDDSPLPIGHGQTISQPYIVALMTSLLALEKGDRVLEVGTGSGYQAAVLAELADSVYSIEIVEPLARRAEALLRALGYDAVQIRVGDGYEGWEEVAPFDAVIVTCAPQAIPSPLLEQLKEGGRMVIPYGPPMVQELVLVIKEGGRIRKESILPVRFVPLTGPHGDR